MEVFTKHRVLPDKDCRALVTDGQQVTPADWTPRDGWTLVRDENDQPNSGRPFPIAYLRQIIAVLPDVMLVLDQVVAHLPFGMCANTLKHGDALDDIHHQMKTVEVVQYNHVEWCRRRSFFLVTAHVYVVMIGSPVSETMNQPWVTVKGEDDRLVSRKERIEIFV